MQALSICLWKALQRLLAKVFKKLTFQDVKVIIDCLVVGIGIILSWLFLGRIEGIREGTVLSALLVGLIMKKFQKVIEPLMNKALGTEEL